MSPTAELQMNVDRKSHVHVVEIPPVFDDVGGNSEEKQEPEILPPIGSERRKRPKERKPTTTQDVVTRFSKDPT